MKSDIYNNSSCTRRHDTEDNSDHVKFCTNTIFGIIVLLVIWFFKLQAWSNLIPISTAFSTLSYTITSLMIVTERIHKGINLSRHHSLTFKTNIHEYITSALWLAQLGQGHNTYHSNPRSNSYSFTLHQFHSYFT